MSNKVKVYTNDEFTVKSIKATYYKIPARIQILGCADPYTLQTSTEEVLCEFPDDVVEVLVDVAASILAGDIESFNQYTRESTASEQNN
jgi:ATP-dependent Clp protease adapter protein ClpS